MEKLTTRIDQSRGKTSDANDFEEKLTKSLKKTSEELKQAEENLNKKADKFYQEFTKQKSQITMIQKELEFMLTKITINTQSCEANFTKVNRKASENNQMLLNLGQKVSSSSSIFETIYRNLSMKVDSNTKKYTQYVRTLNLKFVQVDKDLQNVKTDLSRRRN